MADSSETRDPEGPAESQRPGDESQIAGESEREPSLALRRFIEALARGEDPRIPGESELAEEELVRLAKGEVPQIPGESERERLTALTPSVEAYKQDERPEEKKQKSAGRVENTQQQVKVQTNFANAVWRNASAALQRNRVGAEWLRRVGLAGQASVSEQEAGILAGLADAYDDWLEEGGAAAVGGDNATRGTTEAGGRSVALEAARLPADPSMRYSHVFERLAPYIRGMELEETGTPVDRADNAILGVQPLLQLVEAPAARFMLALRRSFANAPLGPDRIGDVITVGAIGDRALKRQPEDFVVSALLYGEVLLWFAGPGREETGKRSGASLLQQTANNLAAGTMSYLQTNDQNPEGTRELTERAGRVYEIAIAVNLQGEPTAGADTTRSLLGEFGFVPTGRLAEQLPVAAAAIDRRCMVAPLSGMTGDSQESAFLELVAAVARFSVGRVEGVPSSLFNAGVSMLRMRRDGTAAKLRAYCRVACNALGLEAAYWAGRGNDAEALVVHDGADCAVNMTGAVVELLTDNRADVGTGEKELLGAVMAVAGVVDGYGEILSPEDRDRIRGSYSRLVNGGIVPAELPPGGAAAAAHRVVVLAVREIDPSTADAITTDDPTPDARGAYLSAALSAILDAVLETDGFSGPRDSLTGRSRRAKLNEKLNRLIDEDITRSLDIQKAITDRLPDLQEWFVEQPFTGVDVSEEPPGYLQGAGLDRLAGAWKTVKGWMVTDEASASAALRYLQDSIDEVMPN